MKIAYGFAGVEYKGGDLMSYHEWLCDVEDILWDLGIDQSDIDALSDWDNKELLECLHGVGYRPMDAVERLGYV